MSEDRGNNLPDLGWIKVLPQTAKEAIILMRDMRQTKDKLEEDLKEVNKKYDYLRFVHVPKCMEDEGIENLRLTGVGLCFLSPVLRARVNKDKKVEAYQWLDDNGHGALVTETVNAQSLSSAVRQMIEKNEVAPSELFHVDVLTQATIRSK